MKPSAGVSSERHYEICGVILLAFTILLFLSLTTDGYRGEIHRPLDGLTDVPNVLGRPGAATAGVLTVLFGRASHILYCIIGIWGFMLLRHEPLDRLLSRAAGLVLLVSSTAALLHANAWLFEEHAGNPQGGVIGAFTAAWMERQLGLLGTNIILASLTLVGILLSTEFLFLHAFVRLRSFCWAVLRAMGVLCAASLRGIWGLACRAGEVLGTRRATQRRKLRRHRERAEESRDEDEPAESSEAVPAWWEERSDPHYEQPAPLSVGLFSEPVSDIGLDSAPMLTESVGETDLADPYPVGSDDASVASVAPCAEDAKAEDEEDAGSTSGAQLELAAACEPDPSSELQKKRSSFLRRRVDVLQELPPDYVYPKRYTKPPMDLFDPPPRPMLDDLNDRLVKMSTQLEETLKTFGVEARVTAVTRGPTVTRFEIEPAPGVKVSRFVTLADDIALALKAYRVRVEAPIPGKGRVGIEVPNAHREPVVIRDLLESRAFRSDKGQLRLALGKDIAGDVVTVDLASMPHLLVAGATGSGKTVCVKTMIASLLCSKTPEELQLMLVDPKMVELSIFDDIPHLITPVVTDPKKAATALRWLIVEMEERFRLFTHLRVRNIEVYNRSVENGEIEVAHDDGQTGESMEAIRRLPYIVCIIDELADLMMLARAEVEDAIARLAQLARAVGIHLIIATQRPSVDVLTGVIKANFPARLSFQVSSRVDSRCILDEIGAEDLIGRGDMLYLAAGQSKALRIQGAFVSDEEMNRLISYLKTQAPPQYREEIRRFGSVPGSVEDEDDDRDDELLDRAIQVVLETGQASISMVQRRLRVGYTRAARLIDMMEMRGIVGPHVGSKAREILVPLPSTDEVA